MPHTKHPLKSLPGGNSNDIVNCYGARKNFASFAGFTMAFQAVSIFGFGRDNLVLGVSAIAAAAILSYFLVRDWPFVRKIDRIPQLELSPEGILVQGAKELAWPSPENIKLAILGRNNRPHLKLVYPQAISYAPTVVEIDISDIEGWYPEDLVQLAQRYARQAAAKNPESTAGSAAQ